MAIVTDDEPQEPIKKTTPLREREVPKPYQDNVIDTKVIDHSSILTFISGSSWTVNYYCQVLGRDQVGLTQDSDQSNVYQQYKEVIGFELRVQSELSQDQDTETKLFTVVGTSNIYPSLTPNVGDMFVADVGDGRSANFTITSTRRLSIYEESGYEINYKLVDYTTEELLNDLKSKVQETTYFNKEGLRKGAEAFLTKEAIVQQESVKELVERLTGAYVRRFWDKEFETIVLREENGYRIYDHFLIEFFKILDVPWRKIPTGLNCNGIEDFDNPTIWTTMIEGSRWFVDSVEYMEQVNPQSFSQLPALGGIAWSSMERARIPKPGKLPVLPLPEEPCTLNHHPSTLTGHYVLSSWYYNEQPDGMSKLERLLMMWFEGKSLETTELIEIAKDVHRWDTYSQFYQTPIVLTLLLSLEK